jgi:hypothetical protein
LFLKIYNYKNFIKIKIPFLERITVKAAIIVLKALVTHIIEDYYRVMSDSGFSSGPPPGTNIHISQYPPSKAEIKAKLIEIRGPINTQENSYRLTGKVSKQDKDGTTHIRTGKQDFIIKTSPNNNLKVGQTVEIELQIKNGDVSQELIILPKPDARSAQTNQPVEDSISLNASNSPKETKVDKYSSPASYQSAEIKQIEKPNTSLPTEIKSRLLPITNPDSIDIKSTPTPITSLLTNISINTLAELPYSDNKQPTQNYILLSKGNINDTLIDELLLSTSAPKDLASLNSSLLIKDLQNPELINSLALTKPSTPLEQLQYFLSFKLIDNQNTPLTLDLQSKSFIQVQINPTIPSFERLESYSQNSLNAISGFILAEPGYTQSISSKLGNFETITDESRLSLNQDLIYSFISKLPNTIHSALPLDVIIENISTPLVKVLPLGLTSNKNSDNKINLSHITQPSVSNPLLLTSPMQVNSQAYQINAEVIGITNQDLPVVSFINTHATKTVPYVLQFKSSEIDVGTLITFTPLAPSHFSSSAEATFSSLNSPLLMNALWTEVNDLTKVINEISPEVISTLTRTIPNPSVPSRIPAAVLFFLAAMRSGDLSSLLGHKTIEALNRAGKQNILKKLSSELFSQSSSGGDRMASDWKLLLFPMLWEGDIYKTSLYYKEGQQDNEKDEINSKKTRFVFDLVLSRLGPIQLDGLYQDKKLDLVLRTDGQLSEAMKNKMSGMFSIALKNSDLHGELKFQHDKSQFIEFSINNSNIGVSI